MMADLPDDEAVLTGRELAVTYRDTPALGGVDIDLRRGRISAILGPSGAGKSTLLRAIAGFQPLAAGRITLEGRLLSDASHTVPPEQRRMGIVVQNLALFPHLTALQNITFGLRGAGSKGIGHTWLARIGLAQRGGAYPHELSGGEQQRVALARALAPEPAVILLDEAFSSLDPQLRRSLRAETQALLREANAAVLMVTHDPEEAMQMADELIVMAGGHIIQRGAPDALYWRPANIAVAQLLGEVNVFSGLCETGVMHTPFGPVRHAGMIAGHEAQAIVRPSAITLSPATENDAAEITSVEFMGAFARVLVTAPGGAVAIALADGRMPLSRGMRVSLNFDQDRIALFPA